MKYARVSMRLAVLFLALAVAGCSSAPEVVSPVCAGNGTSRAVSVAGRCLRLTTARVLRGGIWEAVELAQVNIRTIDDGAVAIGVEAPAPAEAFELVLDGARGEAVQQQGYQSWSFSGALKIPDEVPLHDDGSLAAKAAFTGDPLDEVPGVSYGVALVGDPGGAGVAVGAASSAVATTAVAVTGSGGAPSITVLYGATREPLPASEGAVHASEIVVAAADRAGDALAPVAAEIKRALPATARAPVRPDGGWYSWNELFAEVTEDDIVENAELAAQALAPEGLPLLEVDDGWEVAWGDWRANDKFPSGMNNLAGTIASHGLTPGVWLAPFLVDVTSEVAKSADPALFVQGADHQPLDHVPSGSTRHYHVLDGTNPASMALVTQPISSLAGSGFSYFKLDFLYAGALPGERHDPAATGTEALARGLGLLRAAMGAGATFNACGAPIFPLLGHADSLRIGSDTAFSGLALNWANVAFAARSTAARAFLSPLTWLDGDQTQVRQPYTADEARASAFVAALSGPAYALGDDLRTLPAARLAIALDPEVLDLAGADEPAVPVDPLESPADTLVAAPLLDTITNPGSTGAPPPSTFTMTGKSGTRYTLTFGWTESHAVKAAK